MDHGMNLLGNWFNAIIDALGISFDRFFALPAVLLWATAVIVSAVAYLIVRTVVVKRGKHLPPKYGPVLLLLLFFSLFFDIKVHKLQNEFYKTGDIHAALTKINTVIASPRLDLSRVKDGLERLFGLVSMSVEPQGPGMDYVLIQINKPDPVKIHVAVIDLRTPGLEIHITPEFTKKSLTSDFAGKNDCVIAINGEAGASASSEMGLGTWSGLWIVKGKPVLLETKNKRPFLSFDPLNRARYFRGETKDTALTSKKYNTLSGRLDAIVDGQDVSPLKDMRQPRTCMGINKEGTKLILLVADGRRLGYSVGLDPASTVRVLKLFDVWNAMFCDQGGSSCMYLKSRRGLVNIPSDGKGVERPVYNSFGVGIRQR
jgi:hypothetical protein